MNYVIKSLSVLTAAWALLTGCCGGNGAEKTPAIPVDKAIEAGVEKTLSEMSLQEKAGQMVQISIEVLLDSTGNSFDLDALARMLERYKIGSILNVIGGRAHCAAQTAEVIKVYQDLSMEKIGIPGIYGLDQIHGATYLSDATFFPQEVNLAATFNVDNAINMANALAYETRASLTPWVFSPVMDITRKAAWSRNWESWGEDPYLSGVMAATMVKHDQGTDPNHIPADKVAACAKHYLAYGAPSSARDRTPAYISPLDLREKYFEPFKQAIKAGALSVMVNSASINGIPTHANYELLTGWLKEGLNWDGLIVTDWADVNNLYTREHIAQNRKEALAVAINAGIDMVMEPYDPTACDDIIAAVNEKLIPQARIDDAVRRILRLKYRLDLFEHPTWDTSVYEMGKDEFKANALAAAIESEVLLKNDEAILPLRQGTKILVAGPNGNSMRTLNGGWSYTWQGSDTKEFAQANTIYEALSAKFGAANVKYSAGITYGQGWGLWQEEDAAGIPAAVAAANGVDVIVACIGENSYCETPGNVDDLALSSNQMDLVHALAKTGKPIVLILNEGRTRLLGDLVDCSKAIVDVMLPSNYGGDALAELLAGDANFSGRLPMTYPKHQNALFTYDFKVSEVVGTMSGAYNYDAKVDVQWPFGYGLSYTTFEYSAMTASVNGVACSDDAICFGSEDTINIKVNVKNTGDRTGKEAVLLYSSDITASVIPDNKRLRAFEKISLEPGEVRCVEFSLPAKDLAFVGADGRWRLEEGAFRLAIADQHLMATCTQTKLWSTQNI